MSHTDYSKFTDFCGLLRALGLRDTILSHTKFTKITKSRTRCAGAGTHRGTLSLTQTAQKTQNYAHALLVLAFGMYSRSARKEQFEFCIDSVDNCVIFTCCARGGNKINENLDMNLDMFLQVAALVLALIAAL